MRSALNSLRRWTTRDFAGEIGEEQRFLDGGVAAADDQHLLVAIEEAIAGGAGRNAEALEMLLRGQVQPLGLGAGADDQRIAGIDLAAIALEPDGLVLQADFGDGSEMISVPTCSAWAFISSISQGPWMTLAKPG